MELRKALRDWLVLQLRQGLPNLRPDNRTAKERSEQTIPGKI